MTEETTARDDICRIAKSMFDRGLTGGSSGNISVRLSNGNVLMTPTGSSFGFLDPARISLLSDDMRHVSGDQPTKEISLHSAFHETCNGTGAVVHLHSCHSTALSMLPSTDPDDALPRLTPYSVMKLGKVKLLPVFLPGDPEMGQAVRGLAGKHSAVLLANHGPVVAGKNLWAASFAMEELEETAKLALMTRGADPTLLSESQYNQLMLNYEN